MKPGLMRLTLITGLLAATIFSCKKEGLSEYKPLPQPGKTPDNPTQPAPATLEIAVAASIKVGHIDYDGVPAKYLVTTWDSSGNQSSRTVELPSGANNISLPANTAKASFKMSQWNVTDEKTLTREQLDKDDTIVFNGTKAAKQLVAISTFRLINGDTYPDGKTEYHYNSDGSLFGIRYYQKYPQYQDLRLNLTDRFFYTSGKLDEIKRYDIASGKQYGFTRYTYNTDGRISRMFNNSNGVTKEASVEWGHSQIAIHYAFDNGHTLSYNMEFAQGNKVKENAVTSRGGGEHATFQYDDHINPYAHMNLPDMYLSNLSKNNIKYEARGYAGAFPSLVPYKWEYSYDAEGYPVQLIKYYKSGGSGEHASTIKTVFTYAAQ